MLNSMLNFLTSREFWISVLSGLFTTFITIIIIQAKTNIGFTLTSLKLFMSITRRMKNSGVTNFCSHGSEYKEIFGTKSSSDYMMTAKKEFIYVGFWFAHGVEAKKIQTLESMTDLLKQGCIIDLVILDENIEHALSSQLASFLAMPEDQLTKRVGDAWRTLRKFRNQLPVLYQDKMILRGHKYMITSSTFIFDYREPKLAKTLVDFKMNGFYYGPGDESSFGIELKPVRNNRDSLYSRLTTSFLEIRNSARLD